MMGASPVIVGAGPAGMRAAQTLVAHGLRPVVIDEAPRAGGQIYRQPPPSFVRSKAALYGFEAKRAEAVHATMNTLLGRIDYRPNTPVWNVEGDRLMLLSEGRASSLKRGPLIVASGATDRVLPFPGWTLPGIYTLGAAQIALKYQGCAIGARVVLAGTGPLLYLVAYQYAKAGAHVAAVLDSAAFADKLAAAPAMLREPAVFAKGLYYLAWLKAHGVAVHAGARPLRALGDARVNALVWHDGQREHTLDCDAIGFGHALRSETQLADLLGCRFAFDVLQRAHLPHSDAAGRSSVPGVYLAGDGAGIRGADAAEWGGERAALALLADAGVTIDASRAQQLERQLTRNAQFRRGLERAFPFPADWAAQASDELVVCRCEEISAGELRQVVRDAGAVEINRLKALSRVGMGRCQGRMCGAAAAEILAHATGQPIELVGRLRGQAPIKPLPFTVIAAAEEVA
jgi:hydrogen cyanide synthase HcnB